MLGLERAAIYSLPPSSLKLCGLRIEKTPEILADYLAGDGGQEKKVIETLKRFEAAYAYYTLIAQANKIRNPLEDQVVEAYWVGNELLDRVKIDQIKQMIVNEFTGPGLLPLKTVEQIAQSIPVGVVPHHSFHVLIIGSVTGVIEFTTRLRDLCLIRWGKVVGIDNQKLKVEYEPLINQNQDYLLGPKTKSELEWNKRFLPEVKIGDWVSFHWNRVCQVLSREEKESLQHYTNLNIQAANKQRR